MTQTKIAVEKLNLWFGDNHVLKDVTFAIPANAVTAIMARPAAVSPRCFVPSTG